MKKYFVIACSLLLFSNTATFAQMGKIIPDGMLVGDMSGHPPRGSIFDVSSSFVMSLNKSITSGGVGRQARLTLKKNELVLEMMSVDMNVPSPDMDFHQKWSISFSGSAKDLIFQSDGNLVVRDANNKVLWAANAPAPRGRRFVLEPVEGKIEIYDSADQLLWEK